MNILYTMKNLCRIIGISLALFYNYFDNCKAQSPSCGNFQSRIGSILYQCPSGVSANATLVFDGTCVRINGVCIGGGSTTNNYYNSAGWWADNDTIKNDSSLIKLSGLADGSISIMLLDEGGFLFPIPIDTFVANITAENGGGKYLPIVVDSSNVDSVRIFDSVIYSRNGNIVNIIGTAFVYPVDGSGWSFQISLPINSDFAFQNDCFGTICTQYSPNYNYQIIAEWSNDLIYFQGLNGVGEPFLMFNATYIIR